MPLFAVQISTIAMVCADDAAEALEVAKDDLRNIQSDAGREGHSLTVVCQNVRPDQLAQFNWDDMCIPYGLDGNTRIKDLGL